MGVVLRCRARLRSCVCAEENNASNGRNSTVNAWDGNADSGRGLV
jgi:hypothetical protein